MEKRVNYRLLIAFVVVAVVAIVLASAASFTTNLLNKQQSTLGHMNVHQFIEKGPQTGKVVLNAIREWSSEGIAVHVRSVKCPTGWWVYNEILEDGSLAPAEVENKTSSMIFEMQKKSSDYYIDFTGGKKFSTEAIEDKNGDLIGVEIVQDGVE